MKVDHQMPGAQGLQSRCNRVEGGTAGTWGRASLGLNALERLGLVTPELDGLCTLLSPHIPGWFEFSGLSDSGMPDASRFGSQVGKY